MGWADGWSIIERIWHCETSQCLSIYVLYMDLGLKHFVVLREPVANEIKYLSNKSSDQNDQSKSKWE